MTWGTEGKRLLVDDVVVWEFPFEIMDSKSIGEWLIIVLTPQPDIIFPDNVFGYNVRTGDRWQVEPYSFYKKADNGVFFVGISTGAPAGQVLLTTWPGVNVLLDVSTGKFISKRDSR